MSVVAIACFKEEIDNGNENAIPENIFFYYTSSEGKIVTHPYETSSFYATILSNTYEDGVGLIRFDAPITTIGYSAFYNCSSLQKFNGKFASTDGGCLIMEGVLNFFAPAGIKKVGILLA